MAINVTISKGYAGRMLIIGVGCVCLGAWGIYDFAVDIPKRQQLHEKAALLETCRDALETEQTAGQPTPEAQEAMNAVAAEMQGIFNRALADELEPDQTAPTRQQTAAMIQRLAVEDTADARWAQLLNLIGQGLMGERHLPLNEQDHPRAFAAFGATQAALDEIGQVTKPGKYDRIMQWGFIACLPFAPYFFWCFFSVRRRRYTLDDDGSLHAPEGSWPGDEIADIDMSRWMAKSIAWAVHRDGRRIKLDDYKFKGLHRIVGTLACRFHPDEWDEDAKPLDTAETPPDTAEDHADPAGDGAGVAEAAAEADAR